MIRRIFNHAALCGTLLLTLGLSCSGPPKPEGLPKLVPFELTLTQEGKPLAEASVQMKSPDVPWPVSGNTNASGRAKMVTYGQHFGAPLGSYKVIVVKRETEIKELPGGKKQMMTVYSLIDPSFESETATTLEVNVEKGKRAATLELGKAVRTVVDSETLNLTY